MNTQICRFGVGLLFLALAMSSWASDAVKSGETAKKPALFSPAGEPEAKAGVAETKSAKNAAAVKGVATQEHKTASVHGASVAKPTPDQVLQLLREGNQRFVDGTALRPHADKERLHLAATSDQGNFALATVLTCSDSRVPPEILFDAGVMDLFVIRVAGNVADVDEIGSIEYGLAHVHTPLLVVLGHTQCGAVKAVTSVVRGEKVELERNIPSLVAEIRPAVERAVAAHKGAAVSEIIEAGITENVWEQIRTIYLKSPAVRDLVRAGKVKVAGAVYHLEEGKVEFLADSTSQRIFQEADADPSRSVGALAP